VNRLRASMNASVHTYVSLMKVGSSAD